MFFTRVFPFNLLYLNLRCDFYTRSKSLVLIGQFKIKLIMCYIMIGQLKIKWYQGFGLSGEIATRRASSSVYLSFVRCDHAFRYG